MAWDGTVKRRILCVHRREGYRLIEFQCGHTQRSLLTVEEILRGCRSPGEEVCVDCSRPNWDRISEIREESIKFDDLIRKLKGAY